MKRTILKIAVCALLAAPVFSRAQDTNSSIVAPAAPAQDVPPPPVVPQVAPQTEMPATNAPVKPRKPRTTFVATGKVSEVDTNAMTLTVGKRTFEITSETRINKGGEPAILSDIVVDDRVGVAYKKADGQFDAITINVKKSKKTDGETNTNSVSQMK
jgi:hypothetical protein